MADVSQEVHSSDSPIYGVLESLKNSVESPLFRNPELHYVTRLSGYRQEAAGREPRFSRQQ
jgi:hypothetical protein